MKKKLNCVLLIDDDKGTNFINQMIIKKSGITDNIQTVLNGKEAIDFITNKGKFEKEDQVFPQPMLTLLDINMPVMDGWEFLEAYHNLEEHQKGKIIIIGNDTCWWYKATSAAPNTGTVTTTIKG